ncbi:MAG: chemotaxis protein CheA [Firmicutes bacterium]|nr:chemotaxis protein CheA [Bacillota bacterium]
MVKLNLEDSYHFMYWEETKAQIANIEAEVLMIEEIGFDLESIHHMFRMAHSIKGSAVTMEYKALALLAHELESLFTVIRDGKLVCTHEITQMILEGVDGLKRLLDQAVHTGDFSELLDDLDFKALENRIRSAYSKIAPVSPSIEVVPNYEGTQKIHVKFQEDLEMIAVKVFLVCSAVAEITKVIAVYPNEFETLEDEAFKDGIMLYVDEIADYEAIKAVIFTLTDILAVNKVEPADLSGGYEVDESLGQLSVSQVTPRRDFKLSVAMDINSVRISNQKVNRLINLVGELTLDKETLLDITRQLKAAYRRDRNVQRLDDICDSIALLASELQEITLSARLIPLSIVFDKLPRMVRGIAQDTGKKIKLEIMGGDQSIDRSMIEEIADPLTHLVRNAIDHGIESAEKRRALGKPEEGKINISARQGDSQVVIEIADDGGGIDISRIKVKALTQNLISVEEAEHLTENDWLEFIFKPGFSTAAEVTELSGRGVGLDVVKSNITMINGAIDIQTIFGKGTCFTIKLPLTMAIMNVLLISEGNTIFGIPSSQILEIIRLNQLEYQSICYETPYSRMIKWEEDMIPLVSLEDIFEIKSGIQSKHRKIIVASTVDRKIAIEVSQVVGEQEVVIKSIKHLVGANAILGEIYEILGVSILGNGSLAQIIDLSKLIRF